MKIIQKLKISWTAFLVKLNKEPEWITIYQSRDEYSVIIKQMILKDAQIPSLIFNQKDSSYQSFGYIHLKVKQQHKEEAIQLLKIENE